MKALSRCGVVENLLSLLIRT